MPQKTLSFIELYFERGLLAIAMAGITLLLVLYGWRSPNHIIYNNREVRPRELNGAILADARDLQAHLESLQPPKQEIPSYHTMLRRRQAEGVLGGASNIAPHITACLPLCVNFGVETPRLAPLDPDRDIILVTPLSPTRPLLTSGRSVVTVSRDQTATAINVISTDAPPARQTRSLSWVTVAGYFDLSAQKKALETAGYANFRMAVVVTGTDVQRQELLADGSYSAWELIDPDDALCALPVPEPDFDDHDGALLNRDDIDQAYQHVCQAQLRRRQPPFYQVQAGADWRLPLPDAVQAGPSHSSLLAEPGTGRAAVWFHDTSVVPGHTYRYRLRVNLWNRYVGRAKLLKHPEQARQTSRPGAWSEPSAPLTIAPDRYIFVCGAQPRLGRASVEVWKWHRGAWLRQRFQVAAGDTIGGPCEVKFRSAIHETPQFEQIDFTTGVILLSLNAEEPLYVRQPQINSGPFSYRQTHSASAVLLHPVSNRVEQRWTELDRYDPIRRQLKTP
ncbi:MAG: hypothetical protein ABIG44_17360 [Planctomycetota bacterium]